MAKYKFKGYTITNCGYHQPDHCVWWEAVDENGEACFHGNTLREVEFMILEHEWDLKVRRKDEEIEKLKSMSVGNAAALREALEDSNELLEELAMIGEWGESAQGQIKDNKAALAKPPRNCDVHTDFNDAITTLANKRNWHDGKWDSERYCILANWLLAPATERKGENDGNE